MIKKLSWLLMATIMPLTLLAQTPSPITLRDAVGLFPDHKERCGQHALMSMREMTDAGLAQRRQQIEAFTQEYVRNQAGQRTTGVLTIPVVVHVVYANATQNITDAQIQSQMTVLNKDFRRQNADAGNTNAAFAGVAADVGIEFCLATIDPNGSPTTGITRTSTSVAEIGNGAYYSTAQGGKDGWDPQRYLNVWVCEITSYGDILGFAWPPGTSSPQEDGTVIDYRYFGTMGTAQPPMNLGRTATHEVGHYLNLEHVWGVNGGCNDDDHVADTPNQDQPNYGCPSHPSTSCNSPDMFMNYMDYVDDGCMNMFSQGQGARMVAALNGPRSGLLSSGGCGGSVAIEQGLNLEKGFDVFPNPAGSRTTISMDFAQSRDVELHVYNILGARMQQRTFTNVQKRRFDLNLSDYATGVYLVELRAGNTKAVKKLVVQ